MEVNLVGDSAETLRALLPLLERKDDRSWREQIESEVAEWWELLERARPSAKPTRSTRSGCSGSSRRGCPTTRSSARTRARRPTGTPATSRSGAGMMASLSGTLATMGPGVPYAIAAKFAYPDAPGVRARRRRRDADERQQRADHDRQVLRRVGRPAAGRAGAEQQRPQPGHLGAARDGGRPQVRGLAGAARLPLRALRRDARAARGSASTTPTRSAAAGTRRCSADRPVVSRR